MPGDCANANPTTWAAATITAYEQRGYTGHEHLDDIGIIHMNGRIYSPKLGRMLSPDPVTQAPNNGQNYNRYTYAYNNPLNLTPVGSLLNTALQTRAPVQALLARQSRLWAISLAATAVIKRVSSGMQI